MKRNLIIALLIIMNLSIFAAGETPNLKTEDMTMSSYTVSVTVKGMVCSFCAQGIKKLFKNELGEKNVTVSVNNDFSKITLSILNNMKISDKRIKEIIIDSGYNVGEIVRN